MPVRGFSATVGKTPVALASNGATEPQLTVSVFNRAGAGSGIIWAGGSNVVVGQGFAIPSNGTALNLNVAGGQLYGVSQENSQTVTGFEVI